MSWRDQFKVRAMDSVPGCDGAFGPGGGRGGVGVGWHTGWRGGEWKRVVGLDHRHAAAIRVNHEKFQQSPEPGRDQAEAQAEQDPVRRSCTTAVPRYPA